MAVWGLPLNHYEVTAITLMVLEARERNQNAIVLL